MLNLFSTPSVPHFPLSGRATFTSSPAQISVKPRARASSSP